MLLLVPFMYLWSRKRLHYTELGNTTVWDLILNKKPAWFQYVGLTAVDKTFTVLGSDYSEDEAPALFSKPQSGCSLHYFFFITLSGDPCLQQNTRPRQMFVPVKNEKDKGQRCEDKSRINLQQIQQTLGSLSNINIFLERERERATARPPLSRN